MGIAPDRMSLLLAVSPLMTALLAFMCMVLLPA